jgi:hypothetical protein
MTRPTFFLLSGAILVSALYSSPAFETWGNQSPRSPVPLRLEGASPAPVALQEPSAQSATSLPALAPPDWLDRFPARSQRVANDNQTMGSGQVDATLEGGDNEGGAAPGQATPEDAGETPVEEDPTAGIAEEGDGEEPIDGYAVMTPEERAAWQQGVRQGEEPEGQPEAPDDEENEDPGDAPEDDDVRVEFRNELSEGELDDVMTDEERAEGARRWEPDGIPGHDPGDPEAPDEDESDDPGDGAADQPVSVLTYLLEDPPVSVLTYLLEDPPVSVLTYMLENAPPARPLPPYDPLSDTVVEAPEAEDPSDAEPAPATLTPGIYVHPTLNTGADFKPGDPMLDHVVLGQPFHISVAVPLDQTDKNNDGAIDDLIITLATEGGETEITLLHDALQDTRDGVWVYRTGTPISLAGKSQGIKVDGTVTGLDLDTYEGPKTVTITVGDQDFSAINVYANTTQRGIGMISKGLDVVGNSLLAQTTAIRQYRQNPGAVSDPKRVAELDSWQARVDRRMAVLQRARTLLTNPDEKPVVKLEVGQFYLERLIGRDENGEFVVAGDVIPFTMVADASRYTDLTRMAEKAGDMKNAIRDRQWTSVYEEVLPAYLIGAYDQFNTWNVPGRFFWAVGGALAGEQPTDHLGRPTTVTHAAIEMGAFVAFIKLPDAIAEWAAGGFRSGRLPSIGVPRFRGTPVRGNVLVPKGPGRLARDTALGTLPYRPGTGGRMPQSERVWWQAKVASRTPASLLDETMALAARDLDELDTIILQAQRKGVSWAEIEAALANARTYNAPSLSELTKLRGAIAGVRRELVIRAANAEGRTIVVHPSEMQEFRDFAGKATTNVRQEDLLMIQGLKARAEFEARHGGKPMYSPDEVALAQRLLREGDDLKKWLEFTESEGGLRHLFDDAAIGDLRKVFGSGGPPPDRIAANRGFTRVENRGQRTQPPADQPPADPFDSRGLTPDQSRAGQAGRPPTQELTPGQMEEAILNAETVRLGRPAAPEAGAPQARPLATLEEYQALVARQAAGERLDLGQIARPGIVRVLDDGKVMVLQGAGRWEKTRPDEVLDVFVDARAPLPEGAVVIERGISPELVRQANLISSRGQTGANPGYLDSPAIRDVPEFTRIQIRARDVDAPTSRVGNEIESTLKTLEEQGVDLTNLRRVLDPLSPNERLAILKNDVARERAIEIGNAKTEILDPKDIERAIIEGRGEGPAGGPPPPSEPPTPPPTGPAQTRLSDLDRQIYQKAFRHGRGENVEWTPEELTRLQQIAYPTPGQRPSVVQQKLMPVADQLGGQMKTLPQDRRTFGQELDLAEEKFLAYQEMEDMIDLARQVGVSDQRIRLLTDGLGESAPVSSLDRASRGLMREIDQARGVIVESGIPADYAFITRMYVVAKANNNKLTPGDVAWLRQQYEADQNFFTKLGRREFEDAAGETFTVMTPSGAADLELMYKAATTGPATTPVSQATPLGTIDLVSAAGAAMLGGASGRGGPNALIETYIVSTGGSTGAVMEAFFVNRGNAVRLEGEGIVLEPVAEVDPATMQRLQQIREAATQGKPLPPDARRGAGPMAVPWEGPSVTRVIFDAYCLLKDLAVPSAGMLFRIADAAQQAAQGDLRAILEASENLRDRGQLHPDDDPEGYFHSVRQWAVWVDEKEMDAAEFEDAFTENAKQNFTTGGGQWTADVEQAVREQFVPGRWRDVEAVLEAAGIR